MARLFTTGFETGNLDDFTSTSMTTIFTSPVRTGTYSIGINNNGYANGRVFTAGSSTYYGQCAIYSTGQTQTVKWFFLHDASTNNIMGFGVNTNRNPLLYINNSVVATSTAQIPLNQWFVLEFYFLMGDSGHVTTKINGVQDIDYSGDTKPGTATTIAYWRFNMEANTYTYYDDVILNDSSGSTNNTWPGAVRLQPVRPNAAGDSTQFARGGTDRGANWDQVDEVPSSHTDYVYTTTVDAKDLYNCATWTIPSGAVVTNVAVIAEGLLDSGSGNLSIGLKSGTESFSTDQVLGLGAKIYEYVLPTQPGGSAWDQTAIDGLQIGIKAR